MVGRVTPCAPLGAPVLLNGAHGGTRPNLAVSNAVRDGIFVEVRPIFILVLGGGGCGVNGVGWEKRRLNRRRRSGLSRRAAEKENIGAWRFRTNKDALPGLPQG